MKRITILAVAVFALGSANAQKITENDVPAPVKQAMNHFSGQFRSSTNMHHE